MDHFKLLLGLGLLLLRTEASVQKFAIEPKDQIALVNSTVILPCRVSDKVGILQWTKDDFRLEMSRNLSERYNIIGNQSRGDYYLEIYPVMLEDDGKYQCQVAPGSDYEQEIRSNLATLTVMVPPDPPRIVQGNYLVAYENMQIKLECISRGGRPAAAINWIDNNGNQLTRGINSTVQVLPDGKRFLIKSILTIIPRMDHRNTTFTCQTQNAAERASQSAELKLDVRYPLHVTVAILSGSAPNGFIPEGADVRLGCHAQPKPSAISYQWFLNDKILGGNFTTDLVLKNVTRKYHKATVKCKISHEHGTSEEGEILNISIGPQFRNKPQSVQADVDENVTLCCDVVGSPLPDMTWWFVNSSQIVSHDANLTVRVTLNTIGRYKCKAHTLGFPDIEAEATVFLKGHPNIISPQTQFGVEGTTVSVECTAHSIPAPIEILWTCNYSKVQGEEYTILEEPLPEGLKSVLVIRELQDRHFGMYICKVTNSYGTDFLEINLKPEETFSFMVMVNVVMIAQLIFAAVLVAIAIFWCRRCRRKRALVNVDRTITDCTPSNPPESEIGRQSVSPKTEILSDPHVDNAYDTSDNCGHDYWPADSRFNENSDLNNLTIDLPRSPTSHYVQVGYSKKRDLATIYE